MTVPRVCISAFSSVAAQSSFIEPFSASCDKCLRCPRQANQLCPVCNRRIEREAAWIASHSDRSSSPWLFAGAVGVGSRALGQLQMRGSISGYFHRDSPIPAAARIGHGALLTGTAWHSASGRSCAEACSETGGVCAPLLENASVPTMRCDCGPYRWGESCSIPVLQPHRSCILNDSSVWTCHIPACILDQGEVSTIAGESRRCEGGPLAPCPNSCSGRGRCSKGRCNCFDGFEGASCEHASPAACVNNCSGRGVCQRGFCMCRRPYWGVDCARTWATSIESAERRKEGFYACRVSPCIYVYELPARMHSLARKSFAKWRSEGTISYRAPMLILEALASSAYRTLDPASANFFMVPTYDFEGCWGSNEGYYRAHRYVTTTYPFWNRSKGTDHIWLVPRDAGTCETPWGSLRDELATSVVVTHWGGQTGLDGVAHERCFMPKQDIVVPGFFDSSRLLHRSPFWRTSLETQSAQAAARTTELFFYGALCYRLFRKTRSWRELEQKCNRSFRGGVINPVARYSFGHRYDVFRLHRNAEGFRVYASDFLPSLPSAAVDIVEEMLGARYCLAPSGTGWGARAAQAVVLGCVPVLVQHDGVHPHVAQPFEPDVLNWEDFSVRVAHDEVKDLPRILRATNLSAKQSGLRNVWTRMLWRSSLPEELGSALDGQDAFDTLMGALAARSSFKTMSE